MNKKEQDAFLRGYNAGRAVMFADHQSGAIANSFRKTRVMSQKTIDRLIKQFNL